MQEYEPIYKARQSNTTSGINENRNRRRRRSGPEEEDESHITHELDSKRLSRLEDQNPQQNVNAGYISMLL